MLQGLVNGTSDFKSQDVQITVYFHALGLLVFLERECGQQNTGTLKEEVGRCLNAEKREEEH